MKNSYQSKPIPLFTHYSGKYSKLCFYFPALHRQTRQAAHSFRRDACAHHTLANFFFTQYSLTRCKMRSHFLTLHNQDRPMSPCDIPELGVSCAPLSLPFTCPCESSTPTVLRYTSRNHVAPDTGYVLATRHY